MYTIELNNARNDATYASGLLNEKSPVVEVFSALSEGRELSFMGAKADKAVKYIKKLGEKADMGDISAISEINSIRKFVIEPKLMQEIKLLGLFGTYKNVGLFESVEADKYEYIGIEPRIQATNTDVTFPAIKKTKVPVAFGTISIGKKTDYRNISLGNMEQENILENEIRVGLRNKAVAYVIEKVFKAFDEATGVKYWYETSDSNGIAKASIDSLLTNIRRYGKPTVVGDYAILSQFTKFAGYKGSIDSTTITGISEKIMNEIASTGLLSQYNGTNLVELQNSYNFTELTADGTNYKTVLPQGLAFVVPSGTTDSGIQTFTRGGITTFSGNSVETGDILTRYDIQIGTCIASTDRIGIIHDTSLDDLG